jgi:hypothetical protein
LRLPPSWPHSRAPFNTIDIVIVASTGQINGDVMVLQQVTRDVVQDLCDALEDDAVEDLCQLLDEVMIKYLITRKEVVLVTVTTSSFGKVLSALEDDKDTRLRISIPQYSSKTVSS